MYEYTAVITTNTGKLGILIKEASSPVEAIQIATEECIIRKYQVFAIEIIVNV